MIVLNINHTDYQLLLSDWAAAMNIPFKGDNFLIIPLNKGKGCIKVIQLHNQLQVLLADITLNEPLFTKRSTSPNRHFVLHFDSLYIQDSIRFQVDDEVLHKSNTLHAVARLTSNVFENTETLQAHQPIRTVKILLPERWLKQYMGLSSESAVLQQYLSLKTESFDIESLDAEYIRLLEELWQVDQQDPLQDVYLQNRVSLLIERFFTRLHEKQSMLKGQFRITGDDVNKLVQVEQKLVGNFTEPPPTIEAFAGLVSMSSTKLKIRFKELFGNSVYAYYQQRRMERARELLLSGEYNVSQTALAVGYQNTSNFITAFKKQYQISPGEMLLNP